MVKPDTTTVRKGTKTTESGGTQSGKAKDADYRAKQRAILQKAKSGSAIDLEGDDIEDWLDGMDVEDQEFLREYATTTGSDKAASDAGATGEDTILPVPGTDAAAIISQPQKPKELPGVDAAFIQELLEKLFKPAWVVGTEDSRPRILICGEVRNRKSLPSEWKALSHEKAMDFVRGKKPSKSSLTLKDITLVVVIFPSYKFWHTFLEHALTLFTDYPTLQVIGLTEIPPLSLPAETYMHWLDHPCLG